MTWTDPIVADVRKHREEMLAECGDNLYELARRLMDSQTKHASRFVSVDDDSRFQHAAVAEERTKYEACSKDRVVGSTTQ